jgi:hypothetical protein
MPLGDGAPLISRTATKRTESADFHRSSGRRDSACLLGFKRDSRAATARLKIVVSPVRFWPSPSPGCGASPGCVIGSLACGARVASLFPCQAGASLGRWRGLRPRHRTGRHAQRETSADYRRDRLVTTATHSRRHKAGRRAALRLTLRRADLAHHARVVANAPVLDDAPVVGEAQQVHLLDVERLVGAREAERVTGMDGA